MFTPPHDSPTNLRLSSTIRTNDVVQMLLSKFKASSALMGGADMSPTCLKLGAEQGYVMHREFPSANNIHDIHLHMYMHVVTL